MLWLLPLLLPLLLQLTLLMKLLLVLLMLPSLSPGFNSRLVHQVYVSALVQCPWCPPLCTYSGICYLTPLAGHIPLQISLQYWNLISPPYLILHMLVIHHPQPCSVLAVPPPTVKNYYPGDVPMSPTPPGGTPHIPSTLQLSSPNTISPPVYKTGTNCYGCCY